MSVNALIFVGGLAVGATATLVLSKDKDRQKEKPASETKTPDSLVVHRPATPSLDKSLDILSTLGGNPGPFHDVFVRQAYVTAYDRVHRHPAWTAEHLTAENIRRAPAVSAPGTVSSSSSAGDLIVGSSSERGGNRESSFFQEDLAIPEAFRAKLSDYFKSGYDRGHMVPAADAKRSQSAMDETFLLTNIAPQVGHGFNRHYWAWVEDFCRRLTSKFEDVYIFTVPMYLPRRDPDGKFRVTYEVLSSSEIPPIPTVSVPTHFAKVIMTRSSPGNTTQIGLGAFVLPNQAIPDQTPLRAFEVPVDAVERAAGLTFFSPQIKAKAKKLCDTTDCQLVVRYFDDAVKKGDKRKKSLP